MFASQTMQHRARPHASLFAGHFYFTKLLLPVLIAAAKNSPAGTVRVVNMSSIAHYMSASEGIRYSTIGPGTDAVAARKKLGAARLFGQSKLVKLHNFPCRWGSIH
jgi:retinol dehydrogenase 12